MGVDEILIGFVISVVAGGFIYIITKDKNIKQKNKNGNNFNAERDVNIYETKYETKKDDPKKS